MRPTNCGICNKPIKWVKVDNTYPEVYPAGCQLRVKGKIRGYFNFAYPLDCGHYLLDDRSPKCPQFAEII